MSRVFLVCCVIAPLLVGCQDKSNGPRQDRYGQGATGGPSLPTPEAHSTLYPSFQTYWYQGKAELTRYVLKQARYGEIHDGEAVLIFVTEDFLPKLQVKQEHGESSDALSVLKLNAYRRFYTGIYPYTLMTSSFTPASGDPTLKLSSSIQEWCGQVYSQINRRGDGLHALMHSYFQDDADQKTVLPQATLEDGLWAQIRIAPDRIPEGPQEIVPALDYLRMRHKALRAYPAIVTRTMQAETDLIDHATTRLAIEYPALGRELAIYYEAEFPHVIEAWEEKIGPYRTTAVRTHAILDDYWAHNTVGDGPYRNTLGLRY